MMRREAEGVDWMKRHRAPMKSAPVIPAKMLVTGHRPEKVVMRFSRLLVMANVHLEGPQ
jgi:hypothetical protein